MSVKFIFITGGVVSSLGKGLAAASIANLLETRGIKVAMLKLDPYLNVDPGTMNPFQHGEVFVTDDGAETDLDLGHYERFTSSPISKATNSTSGQIYEEVIRKERKGEYLGNTVQVIPHITEEIKKRIVACSQQEKDIDLVFVEIGGTAGDIESLPFLEAIRQFRNERPDDCINLHLTYVPFIKAAGEMKTKPTQQSAQILRQIGIFPDIFLCRSELTIEEELKDKIALFCNVPKNSVFEAKDVQKSIYEVPLLFHKQGLDEKICDLLKIKTKKPNLKKWETLIDNVYHPKKTIKIGIVGKYLEHQDAYKSIYEALTHAAITEKAKLEICKLEADKINEKDLKGCDGYLVPGGFGERGLEGKILAAKYCRENKIPYFGICLGMQILIIEFARNVLKMENANSTEMDQQTPYPVISLLTEQKEIENLGGTMRLGAYECKLEKNSKAYKAYQKEVISERHRHRYEFNNHYLKEFEDKGILFSGKLNNGSLCEISEVPNHPWMVGVQFHPEFKSKPLVPHPLFHNFVKAILKNG
ncbi:MAG TPA: CTP synthase [Chlamydiales bacterium]|nr:CTP synthase [Chlamydiales bacterium]